MYTNKWLTSVHALLLLGALSFASPAHSTCSSVTNTWYVKAGANASIANGTAEKPFAALIDAENASCPGDTIQILSAPVSVPALEGGIVLKDNQTLVGEFKTKKVTNLKTDEPRARITNTTGNAVTLANNNVVANIHIDAPLGAGIFAADKTGGELKDLLLTRTVANIVPRIPANYCNLVLTPQAQVDNDNSNLVGCVIGGGGFHAGAVITTRWGGITLLNEDADGKFKLKNIIINDTPPSVTTATRIWAAGLYLATAGHVTTQMDVRELSVNNANRGIGASVVDHGKLVLDTDKVVVTGIFNDGINLFAGYYCAGAPPNLDIGGVTCQQAFGAPIPISHSEIIVTLDRYSYKGLVRPGSGNVNFALGIEVGAGDIGLSRLEMHVKNSVITDGPLGGFVLEIPLGYPSLDSIIDFGCVSLDCKQRGFTSNGNNSIYNNGINGAPAFGGADALTNSIDLVMDGGMPPASPNILYAQNNYWGGVEMKPANCLLVDLHSQVVPPIPANANCLIVEGIYNPTLPYFFDADYPLFKSNVVN